MRAVNLLSSLDCSKPSRKLDQHAIGDALDAPARFQRRDVAPAPVFIAQSLVKKRQRFVLKIALVANVQLEQFAFLGAQAGVDKKFERARGELFHPAHGGAQRLAVKLFRKRWRERFHRRHRDQMLQALAQGCEGGEIIEPRKLLDSVRVARRLILQQWHDELRGVYAFAPVPRARNRFKFKRREKLFEMRQERRKVEWFSGGIGGARREHQPFTRAGEGEVTIEAFLAQLLPRSGKRDAFFFQSNAVGIGQQHRSLRRRGEDGFVHAEYDGEADVGIARAVNRADGNLIERGRDDADVQPRQPRFENRQPFAQGQGLGGKREFDILQPRAHLLPHGQVNRIFARFLCAPCLQRLGHAQGFPEFTQRVGELGAGRRFAKLVPASFSKGLMIFCACAPNRRRVARHRG